MSALEGQGYTVKTVPIEPVAFSKWCAVRNFTPDARARSRYAADATVTL